MKVVALLSGGKDSIYNVLHCILNGHEPIAVASLGPGNGKGTSGIHHNPEMIKNELDSYMYQTVAHSGLSLVAESLSLPFYTRIITGTPINQGNSYGSRSGQPLSSASTLASESELGEEKDETEDMYELLRDVKEKEPTVQGVAVGAILSNYQRVRVEQVCSRLGLVPIAYLWERNQADLLGEMVRAGMESVLVKVAGAGLGVEHLGRSLKQMEPTLHRLNKKYELHICGEGGEYETFTVDCPIYKSRIVFKKTTTIISNSDPYSTVAHLHLDECILEPKPNHPQNETFEQLQARLRSLVSVPAMLDRSSLKIYRAVREAYRNSITLESVSLDPRAFTSDRAEILISPSPSSPTITTIGPWLHFSNLSLSSPTPSSSKLPIESEVKQLFESLIELLSQKSSTLLHLTHLTLYLSSEKMKLFPRINQVYSTYFGTAPPTRACVGILLSPSSNASSPRIELEGIAYNPSLDPRTSTPTPSTLLINADERERKNVHVQSLSYWASANIGPYSQSVIVDGGKSVHVAGQIGLIPRSLELPLPTRTIKDQIKGVVEKGENREEGEEVFAKETSLSLQHLRRVLIASIGKRRLNSREGRGRALNALCWILRESGGTFREEGLGRGYERRLEGAREGWRVGYGVLRRGGEEDALDEDEDEEEEEEDEADRVPLLFVSAEALPKGAKIEWQVGWESGLRDEDDDEGESEEEDDEGSSIIKEVGRTKWLERDPTTQSSDIVLKYSKTSSSSHLLTILVGGSTTCDFSRARHELPSISEAGLLSLKVFHKPGVTREQIDRLVSGLLPDEVSKPERPTTSFICCEHISTLERDVLDVAILMNYVVFV
ncbi:BZ3500_MvSof-1268-A1-R1_Chr12-1g03654 [Microbotryum saponariae]|uniref:Diphthine--ammonia ligase n=1 Tax=Microbotryum saponariae TaxID=289078 RepID=A0A2X0KM05_9BASI|nr:BZ3500_MvSof-1268-A1-R1_Chr12-1g03654 [Microbotryum saponariae]SDA05247.1 BZ3501_MvSof-1269-A2-R1_Chr12-1g03231 [Microbotryum saponariae]